MLGADVLVLHPFRFGEGRIRHRAESRRQRRLGAAVHLGQPADLGARGRREARRVDVHLSQQAGDDPVCLFHQGDEQVLRFELGMRAALGELLRVDDRFLGLLVSLFRFIAIRCSGGRQRCRRGLRWRQGLAPGFGSSRSSRARAS